MKICIRAHDLGVKGTAAILDRLQDLDIDGAVKLAGFVAQGLYDLGAPYADLLAGTDEGADK